MIQGLHNLPAIANARTDNAVPGGLDTHRSQGLIVVQMPAYSEMRLPIEAARLAWARQKLVKVITNDTSHHVDTHRIPIMVAISADPEKCIAASRSIIDQIALQFGVDDLHFSVVQLSAGAGSGASAVFQQQNGDAWSMH